MSLIAERTGIGRATLYKYFPDVEAILTAWHERQVADHLARAAAEAAQPGTRLRAVLMAYAAIQHESHGRHGGALASLLHRGDHVVRAEQHLQDFVRELMAEAARAGEVRDDVGADELAGYCLHALTAAGGLRSPDAGGSTPEQEAGPRPRATVYPVRRLAPGPRPQPGRRPRAACQGAAPFPAPARRCPAAPAGRRRLTAGGPALLQFEKLLPAKRDAASTITAMQQPPYTRQQPGNYSVVRPVNTLAVVSMVVGAASFLLLPIVGAVIAIFTGHEARAQIRLSGDDGAGMALVGLVLGYVNLALAGTGMVFLVILLNVIGASSGPRGFGT